MAKHFECIPTKKLKEILDSNYTTGINGADYEQYKEELEEILWTRLQDNEERELDRMLEEMAA